MHNAGHKTILAIMVITFDIKYVGIKCVLYVTMVFVVILLHYKGNEKSEVYHDLLLLLR